MPKKDSPAIPLFQRLEIESQSNCNRDCWFCPRTYDHSGIYKDGSGQSTIRRMPTETILGLLDQAQALGFKGEVAFYFFSEPLLDPRNPMLARQSKQRGMKTRLHTNGDVLWKNESLCEEIKAVYDLIVIGIYDYASQGELEEIQEGWKKRLTGSNLIFSTIKLGGRRSLKSKGIPRALVPKDARFSVPDVVFTNGPCRRPMIRMLVRYDGEMANCCEDLNGDFRLGNIYEQTLEELWYSEKHVQIIKNLIEGRRDKYSLCRRCPLAPSGPSPSGERIRMKTRQS